MPDSMTPGPWRIVEDNEHESAIMAEDIFIAQVYGVDPGCKANAALIRSAPELLDVAKAALAIHTDQCMNPYGTYCSLSRALQRAIAKAEGK